LIEVLLLHRRLDQAAVLAGIRAALGAGSVAPDVVAIEARRHATSSTSTAAAAGTTRSTAGAGPQRSRAAVVTLGARRQAVLRPDGRPTPSVHDYDQLLTHRPPDHRGTDHRGGAEAGEAAGT
jgi:hypothetical protein